MIRITKQTDYGIVLLTHFAADPRRQYNAPDLAAEAQLPLPMVSKVLKQLAREGLLASHRGVKGGYGLTRPPAEISMAEIIAALEGPIAITECIDENGNCFLESVCQVRTNWQRINWAVRTALAGISLEDMALPLTAHGAHHAMKLVSLEGGHRAAAAVGRESAPPPPPASSVAAAAEPVAQTAAASAQHAPLRS